MLHFLYYVEQVIMCNELINFVIIMYYFIIIMYYVIFTLALTREFSL